MNPHTPDKIGEAKPIVEDTDAPLQVEPDSDEERDQHWTWHPVNRTGLLRSAAAAASHHSPSNETIVDEVDLASAEGGVPDAAMGSEAGHMSDILHWALDSMHDPALAAADWLARDIDPQQPTIAALLSNPKITLMQVKQAKTVFKTMRIVGEKSADRRVGARMYAAAIAAGLVRHGKLISRQSDAALRRGFQGVLDDPRMPAPLRDLAGMALCALAEARYEVDAKDTDKQRRNVRTSQRRPPNSRGGDARRTPRS